MFSTCLLKVNLSTKLQNQKVLLNDEVIPDKQLFVSNRFNSLVYQQGEIPKDRRRNNKKSKTEKTGKKIK